MEPGRVKNILKLLLVLVAVCLLITAFALRYLGFNNYTWDARLIADDSYDGVLIDKDKYREAGSVDSGSLQKIFTRSDIRSLFRGRIVDEFNETALMYLLTPPGNPARAELARELKKRLLDEAEQGNYTGPAHSVKYVQFVAMTRALMFLMLKDIEGLFSENESIRIVDWFKNVVERSFTVEWVDYLYAWKFRIKPQGPYVNQEMGGGALVVFAEVIKDRYPELSRKCLDYIDEKSVFWKGNFRNTDDSLMYQKVWIYSAYLMSRFRPQEELQQSENARKSFEWLCKQWPSTGISPAYNELHPIQIPDILSLGAHLFNDGRYKWIANRILNHMEEHRLGFTYEPTFLYGFDFWNDSLRCVVPDWGSMYLEGPGNLPFDPGPSGPDKIILRDGWDDSSLYLLLNLRYVGWHGYKAPNAVINIICGEPFVGEDYILQSNQVVPLGRKENRDGRIDRIRLNGLQVARSPLVRSIGEGLRIWSPWEQDLPPYASVAYLRVEDRMDVSKSLITDWHGWDHTRFCALVKDKFLAVVDNAVGRTQKKVAITWHLKGNAVKKGQNILLSQNGYRMQVFLPHESSWYVTNIYDGTEQAEPAGEIHDMDLDVVMVSEGKDEFSTVSLFIPDRGLSADDLRKVSLVDVRAKDGSPAYPRALGVNIDGTADSWMLGSSFENTSFRFGDMSCDAELFLIEKKGASWDISFTSGSEFGFHTGNLLVSAEIFTAGSWIPVTWMDLGGSQYLKVTVDSGLLRVQFDGS